MMLRAKYQGSMPGGLTFKQDFSKFGQNQASSVGDVLWSTTNGTRRTANDNNSSPWAFGSGELRVHRAVCKREVNADEQFVKQ